MLRVMHASKCHKHGTRIGNLDNENKWQLVLNNEIGEPHFVLFCALHVEKIETIDIVSHG